MICIAPYWRNCSVEVTNDDGRGRVFQLEPWQVLVMFERGFAVASCGWLRHQKLDAVQISKGETRILLGMSNAEARGHQIKLSGANQLFRTQTVAM